MRQRRLKAPEGYRVAYYHCLSRVVNRDFVFGAMEREEFVRLMREYEDFCGVRILTYCVLSNHFHILVEVSERPAELLTSEQLFEKLAGLSGSALSAAAARQQVQMFRQAGDEAGERAFRERLCALMWDVSAFMKLLKQRFTQWFNRQRGRKGTLWEERFKSVLVEGMGAALATVGAYIDLNPVRAGMVTDPKDYRWCGYGEAAAWGRRARQGLRVIIAGGERVVEAKENVGTALAKYRIWLFGQGEERGGPTVEGAPLRKGFRREEVLAEMANRGCLELCEYLRLKVRYFADGAVLGSRGYVDGVFAALRGRFGARRKSGARRMQGLESELYTVRDLKVRVME